MSGMALTFAEKAKLRAAHGIAAELGGVEHSTRPVQYHRHQPATAPPTPPITTDKLLNPLVISLKDYVSQVNAAEYRIITQSEHRAGLQIYKTRMGRGRSFIGGVREH